MLVATEHRRLSVPEARADAVRRARVALEVVQHLPGGHVHEADVRVKGRREVGLVVLGWHNRRYRFWCEEWREYIGG